MLATSTLLAESTPRLVLVRPKKGCVGRAVAGTGRVTGRRASKTSAKGSSGEVDRGLNLLEWTGALVPQGVLVKGAKLGWGTAWEVMMRELAPQDRSGAYARPGYAFTGEIGGLGFPAESGRYHLYVGNACPWCHRVLLVLALRNLLDRHISISWVQDDPERASRGGWVFNTLDPVFGASDLREVYDAATPGGLFRGRCTAPLLVDKKARRAVCNESSMLLPMLNKLHLPGCSEVDLRPAALQPQIDEMDAFVYDAVNNGVYKSGFATSQSAYNAAQAKLYPALDQLDERLAGQRFLLGDKVTDADIRLYPTIIRYDAVYATLFKCSRKRIRDLPHLQRWLADMYGITMPGAAMQVKDTFDLDDARRSYFEQLFPLNPGGLIPSGPTLEDLGLAEAAAQIHSGTSDPTSLFHLRQPATTSASVPA